jgi:hypothetical protein
MGDTGDLPQPIGAIAMTVEPPAGRTARPGGDSLDPSAEFEHEFGEPLGRVLDLATWSRGSDLPALYDRLDAEITSALAQEDRVQGALRARAFPIIGDRGRRGAPPLAGVHQLQVEVIEKLHHTVLFAGEVEACDGTVLVHDAVALTIIQLGVCLISYDGDEGT